MPCSVDGHVHWCHVHGMPINKEINNVPWHWFPFESMLSSGVAELHDEVAWTLSTGPARLIHIFFWSPWPWNQQWTASPSIQRAPLILAPSRSHHFFNAQALAPLEWHPRNYWLFALWITKPPLRGEVGANLLSLAPALRRGGSCWYHMHNTWTHKKESGCSRQGAENKSSLIRGRKRWGWEKEKEKTEKWPSLRILFAKYLWKPH